MAPPEVSVESKTSRPVTDTVRFAPAVELRSLVPIATLPWVSSCRSVTAASVLPSTSVSPYWTSSVSAVSADSELSLRRAAERLDGDRVGGGRQRGALDVQPADGQ